MPLLWVLLWSSLPHLALLSGADRCGVQDGSSSQSVSPLLDSLQCHNDYESHVHCKWRKHSNTTLQLWFKTDGGSELCLPYDAADAAEHRTVHCGYKTQVFAIGIEHTAFFLQNLTLSICSSVPHKPVDLLQRLRARPPVDLSTHDAGDGGRRLRWSSPYPSSSSLSNNLTYQLSYRTQGQDDWTTVDVTTTAVDLQRQSLLPGLRYEARVRARARVGQWSDWSPVVSWQTKDDFGQLPALHCVLDGEREVVCSWEVSRELAHFITYQLACRHNQIAASERCCVNPTVSPDLGGRMLRYSCSLTVAEPEHLLLDLLPTHTAKTFKANQHIQPKPPQQVTVRKKDTNWIVEWTQPSTELRLFYQVCYYRTQHQKPSVLLNIPEGKTFQTIPGTSLVPSQDYQVKVRSLVVPGDGPSFEGIPSQWTTPVAWTSSEATWSLPTLIYILIGVFVASVFLTLYCTIPACKRRVILWVDSVPSPGKSKVLSDIQSASSRTLMQSEKTFICKVQHLDSISTCSSDALLWPTKDADKKCLDQDEGCWSCDNLPSPVERVNSSDTSSISFSGPYILCQSPEPAPTSVDVRSEEEDEETPSRGSASPAPVNVPLGVLRGEGYVCLPSHSVSRSTQDLVSRSNDSTSSHWHSGAEQDQQRPDTTLKSDPQPGLSEPTSRDQPPEYTSEPFTSWPQEGTVQASGYCHLPTAFTAAAAK